MYMYHYISDPEASSLGAIVGGVVVGIVVVCLIIIGSICIYRRNLLPKGYCLHVVVFCFVADFQIFHNQYIFQ